MTQLYLSHWNAREATQLAEEWEEYVDVVTNFDASDIPDPDHRADQRMRWIAESDMFVYVAPPEGKRQLISNIELGYALGAEKPLIFIGNPRNAYHRFGDVFDDTDTFLDVLLESETEDTEYPALQPVPESVAS